MNSNFFHESSNKTSLAGSILALAAPDIGFKKCCMRTGRYEGAPRNHYNR